MRKKTTAAELKSIVIADARGQYHFALHNFIAVFTKALGRETSIFPAGIDAAESIRYIAQISAYHSDSALFISEFPEMFGSLPSGVKPYVVACIEAAARLQREAR